MKPDSTTASAFSLMEVLVATAISSLVLAAVVAVIITAQRDWRTGSAHAALGLQGRVLRERLLHGIQGQFGLEHARRSSVIYTNNTLQFQDAVLSNRFTILLQPNLPLRVRNAAGVTVYSTRSSVLLQSASVTRATNILTLDLTLYTTDRRRTWTQPQRIRTYLLND